MTKAILRVENLNKNYGALHALDNVSLNIYPGEIVGLLGHNGAGKSTLIKCLMGALRSYSGDIFIGDKNIRQDHGAISENSGFLLEPSFCDYLSARANLELVNALSENSNPERVQQVLELVSLKKFADKKVSGFSFGMRQRLGLAQVLLNQPKLIVLDEPTVGLDPIGVEIINDIIVECSKNDTAVLFSSHQIDNVLDICTRVVVMNEGRIVFDGSSSELNRKFYLIQLDKEVDEAHKQALKQIDSSLEIDGDVIRFYHTNIIDAVIEYVVKHQLTVVDMNVDIRIDGLKTLMKR